MNVVPVLDSRLDVLSCDWPQGKYSCQMTSVRDGSAIQVSHQIDEAEALIKLVESGSVRCAVEVTSPRTFSSSLELAPQGSWSHTLDLAPLKVAKDGAQARPGLLAVVDCKLPSTQLSAGWQAHGSDIEVRAGQWLARGQHAELSSPKTSLVKFVADQSADQSLKQGELRCRYAQTHYEVSMHPSDLTDCKQNLGHPSTKTILLAAYVCALADAAKQSAFGGASDGDEQAKEPIGYQLEAAIKDLDPECPTPGEDDYDPLRAATILLRQEAIISFVTEED